MGGTTLEMIIPSTVAISRPAGENRLRSRMPHSSAVCSCTVRKRHWLTSRRPSNAPIVMLLLPASRASSTYASRHNQGIGSVVPAHHQIAIRRQPGGGSFYLPVHHHAPPGRITRPLRKQSQNIFRRQRRERV